MRANTPHTKETPPSSAVRSGDSLYLRRRALALTIAALFASAISALYQYAPLAVAASPEKGLSPAHRRIAPSYLADDDTDSRARFSPQESSSQPTTLGELAAGTRIRLRAPLKDRDMEEVREIKSLRAKLPSLNDNLEQVEISLSNDRREARLTQLPDFSSTTAGRVAGLSQRKDYVFYSLDPELQNFTRELVQKAPAPHLAVVAMEPSTGKILAIADKSSRVPELSLHAGFPAASLFKIVTSAAALEHASLNPDSVIRFRGSTYTLERWNYSPNARTDRKAMTLAEALGRSCNPVFARVALLHLSPKVLADYARAFGFNEKISFDTPLPESLAEIPTTDAFSLGRAAAGFGDVTLSPVHAAAIMSGIAHGGELPRPYLIDSIYSRQGETIYTSQPRTLGRIVNPQTASTLLEMMEATTTLGTSQREFRTRQGSVMNGMAVAAKTGTLRGSNPPGINHWFLAAAPREDPRIAVSVISIDPTRETGKAAHIGRLVLEKFFGNPNPAALNSPPARKPVSRRSKRR